jgi:D-alanine-D-alanine ligase
MDKNSKIIVIAGGFSAEREVSLRSGKNLINALHRLGYKNSEFFDLKSLASITELSEKASSIDLAVLMTHGRFGEDGSLQGLMELLKVPYTGSGVRASANCMHKVTAKQILAFAKLPVLPSISLSNLTSLDNFGLNSDTPLILKPIDEGSSVGITKLNNLQALNDFLKQHSSKFKNSGSRYFVEPFIKGIELTASIVDLSNDKELLEILKTETNSYVDGKLASLPLLELKPKNEFYDYEAKYTPGMTEFTVPANIAKDLSLEIHSIALKAYSAMACKGFARVDFIISDKPYILELNTLPGMTDTSDLPAQAKAAGISYDRLVELLLSSPAAE